MVLIQEEQKVKIKSLLPCKSRQPGPDGSVRTQNKTVQQRNQNKLLIFHV